MAQVRAVIEVTASVMPPEVQFKDGMFGDGEGAPRPEPTGFQRVRPEPEHTRQFALTSEEWRAGGAEALKALNDEALQYAAELMLMPDRFNHVRVDWLWM